MMEARCDGTWVVVLAENEEECSRVLLQRLLERRTRQRTPSLREAVRNRTLDRFTRLPLPARKAVALSPEEGDPPEGGVELTVRQPEFRGTAAGIFLPLAYIRARDPNATAAIFPRDFFAFPEDRFFEYVGAAFAAVGRMSDRVALLAAVPDRSEPDYGCVRTGRELWQSLGRPVKALKSFREAPGVAGSRDTRGRTGLWNTRIVVARIPTLWSLGWRCFPEIMLLFERLSDAIGSREEASVLGSVFRTMPDRDFTADLMARMPHRVAVIEMKQVFWGDSRNSKRVLDALGSDESRKSPRRAWLAPVARGLESFRNTRRKAPPEGAIHQLSRWL